MGSDHSKSRDSRYNPNSARRHNVHPQSPPPPTRTAYPSSSYQQAQKRAETIQHEPERVRQTYSYAQTESPANFVTTSLYPRLEHTPLNQQNAQVNSSHAAANRTDNTTTTVIEKGQYPSPAAQTTGHNQDISSAAVKSSYDATATTQTNAASANPFGAQTTGHTSAAATTSQRTENKQIAQAAQYSEYVSLATAQTSARTKTVNPFAAETTGYTSIAAPAAASPRTENQPLAQINLFVADQNSRYISSATALTTDNAASANPVTAQTTGHILATAAASQRTDNKPIAKAAQFTGCVSPATTQTSANTMTVNPFAAQKSEYTTPAAQRVASPARTSRYASPCAPKSSVTDETFVFVNKKYLPKAKDNPSPSAPPSNVENKLKGAIKKQRSRSKVKGANTAITELNINCPTCNEQYTENIFQCGEGHSACETCKETRVRCRLCRLPITDMRNFALQEYVCEIKTPCQNASEGCMYNLKIGNMAQHLRDCPFQELDCPLKAVYGRCNWRGKLSQLVCHFDSDHPENRQGNVDQEMFLPNIYYDEKYVHFVEIGCYRFLLHLRVSESQRCVFMTVQLIGTKNNATKWTYDIHVYNKRQPRRKYQFSDACHSIGISTEEIFSQANCAVLPLPLASSFIHEGTLTYKFYIKKDIEKKQEFVPPRRKNNGKN